MPAPMLNSLALTLDVDWAPDFMIEHAADLLRERGVRATWFVTHPSPAVERLLQDDLFEIGIHPNFMPGSTHGDDPDAVFRTMLELVPGASVMRTHGLMQSTPLLQRAVEQYGLTVDASLFLPRAAHLQPHRLRFRRGGPALCRVPYNWEDDFAMYDDETDHTDVEPVARREGLRVLDFHPVHVFLNSHDMGPYESLKAEVGLGNAEPAAAGAFRNHNVPGTADFFTAIADLAAARPDRGAWISEIAAAWEQRCES